jgi:pentatricopeptide repeat protein
MSAVGALGLPNRRQHGTRIHQRRSWCRTGTRNVMRHESLFHSIHLSFSSVLPQHHHDGLSCPKTAKRMLSHVDLSIKRAMRRAGYRIWSRQRPPAIPPQRHVNMAVNVSRQHSTSTSLPNMETSRTMFSSAATPNSFKHHKRARLSKTLNFDELLRRTEQLIHEATSSKPSGTVSADDCYHTLEDWICIAEQRKVIDAARHAERLLAALESNLKSRRRTVLVPHASYYDVVLQAYAVCGGQQQAAESAKKLLYHMLSLCRSYAERSTTTFVIRPCEPSAKAWNIAINCWAKSGHADAGQRAELLFNKMEEWQNYCTAHRLDNKRFAYRGYPPTERTLTGVLDAWSKSRHIDAPERATNLLHRIVESKRLGKDRYSQIRLDAAVFNSCIAAWSRSGRGREGATKAEGILRMMSMVNEMPGSHKKVSPNSRTYTMVLSAWAQCEKTERTGDAARRAESILNQMIHLYQTGSSVKPNYLAFTTCITAWARSRQLNDAAERAEILLRRLIRLYSETGDADFKPDTYCGNAVVSAWARATHRPDSVERAFLALRRMKAFCDIDMIGYSALLDALQKKGLADQALVLLETIERSAEVDNRLVPTVIEYNTVLSALARCGRPDEVEGMLIKMDEMAKRPERSAVKPDKLSFTIAIDAWSRSQSPDALRRASSILDEMLRRYRAGDMRVKPDHFTFSVLMKTCLQARESDEEKQHSLEKAMEFFNTHEVDELNHISYSLLLLLITKQASDLQKGRLLASVFEACKEAGLVSQGVIDALGQNFVATNLDAKWSRQVPRKEWPYT